MESGQMWEAAAAAETAVTVTCAGLTAGFFLNAYRRAASPGRRTAALALSLTAVGAAAQATLALAWRTEAPWITGAGLPACTGQVLTALLVLRQMGKD